MRFPCVLASVSLLASMLQGDGVIRLKPADFRQLPAAVRRDLDRRGCRIPQVPDKTAPHNVISGSFIASGSRDWAVLCSVGGSSRILVYRNSSVSKVDSLARMADSSFMQRGESGVMEFSRKIDLADAKRIADHGKENSATIRYYSRGKWHEQQGAN